MPRLRIYTDNAERQRAYRDRLQLQRDEEMAVYRAKVAEERDTVRAAAELMEAIRTAAARSGGFRSLASHLDSLRPPAALRELAKLFLDET